MLAPDDVLNVQLAVSAVTPAGALPTIKHPEVVLVPTATGGPHGLASRGRDTGRSSVTRRDAVWQVDPLAGLSG